MRQRISTEELMELTPEQVERLREWWNNWPGEKDSEHFHGTRWFGKKDPNREVTGYYGETYDYDCFYDYEDGDLPLLSIGQCIELLYEKGGRNLLVALNKHDASVFAPQTNYPDKPLSEIDEGDGLIAALWQAVKVVL